MELPQPIQIEEKVQKPAILVNKPGEELIDPLEKMCMQLDDISRTVTRYYITSMQKEIDLDNPKPTLAQRTRFNRLNKLNAILIELTEASRNLNKWRTKHVNLSEDVKKVVDKTIHRMIQIVSQLSKTWMSVTLPIDSLKCLKDSHSIERKVIEYHVSLEDLLEALIRMIVRLQRNKEVSELNSLPIVPDNLARVEMSFPVKLSDHEAVAAEIHGKK